MNSDAEERKREKISITETRHSSPINDKVLLLYKGRNVINSSKLGGSHKPHLEDQVAYDWRIKSAVPIILTLSIFVIKNSHSRWKSSQRENIMTEFYDGLI